MSRRSPSGPLESQHSPGGADSGDDGVMRPEHYETLDGSTPDVTPLAAEVGRQQPLSAFTLLAGGDVFEARGGRPPSEGPARARAYVKAKLEFKTYGAPAAQVQR